MLFNSLTNFIDQNLKNVWAIVILNVSIRMRNLVVVLNELLKKTFYILFIKYDFGKTKYKKEKQKNI